MKQLYDLLKYAGAVVVLFGALYFAEDRYINTNELEAFEEQTVGAFKEFRDTVRIDQLYSKLNYLTNLRMQILYYLNTNPGDVGAREQLKDIDNEILCVKRQIAELMYGR